MFRFFFNLKFFTIFQMLASQTPRLNIILKIEKNLRYLFSLLKQAVSSFLWEFIVSKKQIIQKTRSI
jgi:hypothetical protein